MTAQGRTWEDNAIEYGQIAGYGGEIRLAVLAVCSAESGIRGANNRVSSSESKVSVRMFAAKAGVSAYRVQRHLGAWDRVRGQHPRGFTDRAKLHPSSIVKILISDKYVEAFERAYREEVREHPQGGKNGSTARSALPESTIETLVSTATPSQLNKLAKATRSEKNERAVAQGKTMATAADKRLTREIVAPEHAALNDIQATARGVREAKRSLLAALTKMISALAHGVEIGEIPGAAFSIHDLADDLRAIDDGSQILRKYLMGGSVAAQAEKWINQHGGA